MPVYAPSKTRPLYREIVKQALSSSWHHHHLWVLAFFAGLLQTGGMYDVILRGILSLPGAVYSASLFEQSSLVTWLSSPWQQSFLLGLTQFSARLLSLFYGITFLGLLFIVSVLAQGALVYGLAIRFRGAPPSLRSCLQVGGRSFWSVAILNILSLGGLAALRSILFAPSLLRWSSDSLTLGIIGTAIYAVGVLAFTAFHLLALNSVVLQKHPLAESLGRAWIQLKTHWLTIAELGVVFLVTGGALLIALVIAMVIAGIPLATLLLSAALINWGGVVLFLLALGAIALIGAALVAGSFAVAFQYAAWQELTIRASQGQALSKLHRWYLGWKERS